MKVYIVHRDVDCEFGQIFGVFDSREKAENFMDELSKKYIHNFDEEFSIQEWGVE